MTAFCAQLHITPPHQLPDSGLIDDKLCEQAAAIRGRYAVEQQIELLLPYNVIQPQLSDEEGVSPTEP